MISSSHEILQNWLGLPFLMTSLAAFCVGMAKGGVPTIGMVAVPLISLVISPITGAALLLPIFILCDMVSVALYRKSFSRPNLSILIPAGLAGVALGWLTASSVSDRVVAMMVGALGIGFCLNIWLGKALLSARKTASVKRGLLWGTLAGYTSFIAHAGSPPYQIYIIPQRLEKLTFVGTTAITFAVINLAKVVPYYQLRPYTPSDFKLTLWLLPAALAGILLGVYLTKKVSERSYFRLIQIGLLLVSCKLIVQSL